MTWSANWSKQASPTTCLAKGLKWSVTSHVTIYATRLWTAQPPRSCLKTSQIITHDQCSVFTGLQVGKFMVLLTGQTDKHTNIWQDVNIDWINSSNWSTLAWLIASVWHFLKKYNLADTYTYILAYKPSTEICTCAKPHFTILQLWQEQKILRKLDLAKELKK